MEPVNRYDDDSKSSVAAAICALASFLSDANTRSLESVRLGRACSALLIAGCNQESSLCRSVMEQILKKQNSDGGWSDPEETAWATSLIGRDEKKYGTAYKSALRWIACARKPTGAWGRNPRDQAKMPVTSLICFLTPEVIEDRDLDWLTSEWKRDLEAVVQLSYKAGFFLIGMAQRKGSDLISRTVSHLVEDQNDDGGFGPWKGHPIGSDPWSTGVVLWGLSKWIDHVDAKVIEKALDWLRKTQLPSGYWPYHYLDDGTSLALIGAVSAMKALAGKE